MISVEEAVHIKVGASFCAKPFLIRNDYVVKDSERWGKQRTMLLEQRKKMEEKYAPEGRFPNGQAVFEEEWKPKFVDLEEDLVQAAEKKRHKSRL